MYIGEAAQLSGATVKSIRHYEAIGLLPPARRQGAYRLYGQDEVERLMFIKCAQQLGFKLKELQTLFARHHGEGFPWELVRQALAEKKRELTRQIESMQHLHARLEGFETSLEAIRHECRLGSLE